MRVVLADDSILLREGVARLLAEADFDVVGQAADADELLEQVAAHQPYVAIVDIRMPPDTDGGLRAAREIRARHPDIGVLVLSQYARPSYAFELLSDNAERVKLDLERIQHWIARGAQPTGTVRKILRTQGIES